MTDSPLPLAGQTALITGAGSGLGAAIARSLARAGVACVLAGRRPGPLESVAAEIAASGGQALAVPCDVADEGQVGALAERALAAFGRVDALVNNAGLFQIIPFSDTSAELFDRMLAVNLRGAFLCCKALWEPMKQAGGGQIVNISSVAGMQGFAGSSAYCASKFGLNGLSEALALEGREHNIRVVAVCPGNVNTPIWEGQAPEAVRRRMMAPEPVADFVAWLLAAPREVQFDALVMRNFGDPWEGEK